jgi:hypothetical protein
MAVLVAAVLVLSWALQAHSAGVVDSRAGLSLPSPLLRERLY